MEHFTESFIKENITPDIVCLLSAQEMRQIGITNRASMVKLRNECVKYGPRKPQKVHNGCGPAEFLIPSSILKHLIEDGFTVRDISNLLSVSEKTVYRRMQKFALSKIDFNAINDHELDLNVAEIIKNFPFCGENLLGQMLKQKGISVQRCRLRESMHRLDEKGIEERKRGCLKRRVYDVKGPNHLWHIDTNHKLIRWHIIIAGGIDGFSRMVTFLECLENNKAETLLRCFLDGVRKFGLPRRVRSDKGLENTAIADHMIQQRGTGRGSMITGRSVHNQRIERLWKDVYTGVLCFYYNLFYHMEEESILDPLNDFHIAALHYTFIPRINQKLKIWQEAWAGHRIRTVRTSPRSLWISGQFQNPIGIDDIVDTQWYGTEGIVDYTETGEENPRPIINFDIANVVSEACKQNLDSEISSMISSSFGIDIYSKALDIIQRHQAADTAADT